MREVYRMLYIGIDPGESGAVAIIDERTLLPDEKVLAYPFGKLTPKDICETIRQIATGPGAGQEAFCAFERVNAMPKQGVASSFKFGVSYGRLDGLLLALNIPYELVAPSKWQGYMNCRTGGDKNITKALAQRLFPQLKITHSVADALLLAEYCRRTVSARKPTSKV